MWLSRLVDPLGLVFYVQRIQIFKLHRRNLVAILHVTTASPGRPNSSLESKRVLVMGPYFRGGAAPIRFASTRR